LHVLIKCRVPLQQWKHSKKNLIPKFRNNSCSGKAGRTEAANLENDSQIHSFRNEKNDLKLEKQTTIFARIGTGSATKKLQRNCCMQHYVCVFSVLHIALFCCYDCVTGCFSVSAMCCY
jgi:hypothetical protein